VDTWKEIRDGRMEGDTGLTYRRRYGMDVWKEIWDGQGGREKTAVLFWRRR